MVFRNGVKNIQTTGYNGAPTVTKMGNSIVEGPVEEIFLLHGDKMDT